MNIVKTGSSAEHAIRPFLKDIEPFFHRRPVIYVDAGAYSGAVYREVYAALKPTRAYLVEPNPASYARLKETVADLKAERVATCYNLALGAAAGTLRLRARDTMTRVLGATDAAAEATSDETDFEIPAQSLDALAADFLTPHISLLKIDVEGFETKVLEGAAGLLGDQAIDMIYVEAGLDPENRQQTYYREIEDRLQAYGYRLFRIYEQQHEWTLDAPMLRRMNLAFISPRFADGAPFRLSKELFTLRARHADLEERLAERGRAAEAATREVEALKAALDERGRAAEAGTREAETLKAALAERDQAAEAATREAEALKAALAERDQAAAETAAALEALRQDIEAERAARAAAEQAAATAAKDLEGALARRGQEAAARERLSQIESYARTLETRHIAMLESETWRVMEPARRTIRFLTGKRAPAPFKPRLVEGPVKPTQASITASASALLGRDARKSGPVLSKKEAQKAASQLISLAAKRDYPGLLAREAQFARSEKLDQSFFLRRFARLLALKALSAFSEAVEIHEQVEARLGEKHGWLVDFFGPQAYQRYTIDASTSLTRIGRLDAARRLVDGALARLDAPPALLRHRAEMLWTYAPEEARADLAAAAVKGAPPRGYVLLEAYLGVQAAGAEAVPDAIGERLDEHPEMALVAAVAASGRSDFPAYRTWFNRYFEGQGLSAPLPPDATRFAFDALGTAGTATWDGPLVSVVMTTFDSAETVDYAVRSITAQTHANLEILIVDDCSADGTRDRLAALAAADPRIRILLNTENVGTYVSKNRAIIEARGDYVTLHDSDDWAHPERIARHVALMEATRSLAVTRSEWLRVDDAGALSFRRWGCKFQHPNPASTLIRRAAFDKAGYFDSVRYGADSEYWFRLNRLFPGQVKSLPLCLCLGYNRSDSLSQSGSGAMALENYSPTRGAYAGAYLAWHVSGRPAEMKLPPRLARRPFPAPVEMVVAPPEGSAEDAGGATPAEAAGPPEFMFGISLVSERISADWKRTQELLGNTLRSVLNQSDPRFSVVICGHERPDLAELDDPRVLFLEAGKEPPRSLGGFNGDKNLKRRLIGAVLRARGGGYFFPLDADDLVHRDVVAHTLRDDNRKGYLIDRGYTLDYGNHVLAPIPGAWSASFDRCCGSAAVIWFEPDELPIGEELDDKLYFNLFQSHAYWMIVAEEYGRRLDPFPFAAGVYVVNHDQNISFRMQRKGARTENIARAIRQHRVENDMEILGESFGQTTRVQ